MHEATFHICGDVPYQELTRSRDVSIELWCNKHRDLLHIKGSVGDADGDGDGIDEEIVAATGVDNADGRSVVINDVTGPSGERILITSDCLQPYIKNDIEGYLAHHDCLLIPPLRYEGGGKLARVVAFESEDLTRFYRDVQESFQVSVHSKREIEFLSHDSPMLSADSLVPDLSERQREAVVLSWEAGYYRIPREATTEELAERMGIDRRTFEEHLRIAERKIVGALIDRLSTGR